MRKYKEKDIDDEATFSRTKRTLPSGARKATATSDGQKILLFQCLQPPSMNI